MIYEGGFLQQVVFRIFAESLWGVSAMRCERELQ